ncbi:hypothetical protein mRhiFer1_008732 [Rhinolophus ferrumequinum]|uniref:Uncharacterized protein n=1 Tax=Rhinolophus ferrumequinum TaxID=59479 RepID=A0A7J7TR99_RHIFE|nr:hypothetical protein mRhiFer1_008732 [Rhinolophus ferrumequinum]
MGATGDQAKSRPFCQARTCKLGGHTVSHEFLYLPDCPILLLGRDLLTKLGAQISFEPSGQATMSLQPPSEGLIPSITTPREEEWRLYGTGSVDQNPEAYRANFPEVWAEDNPPGLAKYKAPVLVELRPGAQPQCLRQYSISREAQAGIQKHLAPSQNSRDTHRVPVAMEYTPPAVPNPYTLLSQLPPEAGWFTCLDLKDAFFCICLCHRNRVANCEAVTPVPAETGYRDSWKKAQFCRQYLGFVIYKGQQALSTKRKKVITSLPRPTNRRALRECLGAAGFCRIWIPGFSAITQPLYEALTGQERPPCYGQKIKNTPSSSSRAHLERPQPSGYLMLRGHSTYSSMKETT